MFRAEGRNIRITRGDTGIIAFRPDKEVTEKDRAVFSVKKMRGSTPLLTMVTAPDETGAFRFTFESGDTSTLREGEYEWDVRFVLNAQEDETGRVTGGEEIITPFKPHSFTIERTVGEFD